MKLKRMRFLLLLIVTLLFTVSCSDDKKKDSYNPTDAEYLPDNYAKKIAIFDNMETEENNDFIAMIGGFEESDEVFLNVCDTNFPTSFGLGVHLSLVILDGSINDFELIVNGSIDYKFTLKNVSIPEANWPQFYPIGEAFDLEWTLSPDKNPMYQKILYDGDEDEYQFTLDPSDRDFTIPAEWSSNEQEEFDYEIELWVINYDVDEDLLATSVSLSMGDYDYFQNSKSVQEKVAEYLDKFTITK